MYDVSKQFSREIEKYWVFLGKDVFLSIPALMIVGSSTILKRLCSNNLVIKEIFT